MPLQPNGPAVGPGRPGCDHGGVSETTPAQTDDAPPTTAAPGPGGSPEERRQRRLASWTVRNMVYSMLLVTLVVLAWWSMTSSPATQQQRTPELEQTTNYVVDQAEWPVWVPDPGEGWTPTVVWYDARVAEVPTWHISYVSPEGEYVALHQAADVTEAWLESALPEAAPTGGTVRLPGPVGEQTWQVWSGPARGNAETAYLLGPEVTGGSTVAVHGTAGQEEFADFLASVEARD